MQQVVSRHAAAVAAQQQQSAAWNEVSATVAQARGTERAAHETLARRIQEHGTLSASIKQNRFFVTADALTGALGGLHNARNSWTMRSLEARHVAGQARSLLNGSMTQAERNSAIRIMLDREEEARRAARAAASNGRLLAPVGGNTQLGQRALDTLGRGVKGVPVAGTLITAAQIHTDIEGGKDADRAIASGVSGMAVGTATTSGVLLLAGAASGPVTLGAVALGIGASMLVSWAVDEYWDDIEDAPGAVGEAIERSEKFHKGVPDVRI